MSAKFQLEIGKYYRARGGYIAGPVKRHQGKYPFSAKHNDLDTPLTYTETGQHVMGVDGSPGDLIEEVPAPGQPTPRVKLGGVYQTVEGYTVGPMRKIPEGVAPANLGFIFRGEVRNAAGNPIDQRSYNEAGEWYCALTRKQPGTGQLVFAPGTPATPGQGKSRGLLPESVANPRERGNMAQETAVRKPLRRLLNAFAEVAPESAAETTLPSPALLPPLSARFREVFAGALSGNSATTQVRKNVLEAWADEIEELERRAGS